MIKQITIINHLNESLELELASPEKSGLAVLSVTGLGPPSATINTTEGSGIDGSIFDSAYAENRNVVFTIKYLDPIEENRHKVYKYFPIKKNIRMIFKTTIRTVELEGYVESNEALIFSSDTGSTISIICPRPYPKEIAAKNESFGQIEPYLSFELLNPTDTVGYIPNQYSDIVEEGSTEYDTHIVETLSTDHTKNFINSGEIEVGLLINLDFSGPATNIRVSNMDQGIMYIDTSKLADKNGNTISITNGDRLTIDTRTGSKKITFTRNAETWPIFNCISKDFLWLYLIPGSNTISYAADTGVDNITLNLNYETYYQGV